MNLVQELESAFERGEMEGLKAAILPFVRAHREKLTGFILEFQRIEGPTPLERMIKIFILQQNLPFDMREYMARQSDTIRREVPHCEDSEDRRVAVTEWIRRKAADHRSYSMFQQVFCFEKMKDALLPLIEEELGFAVNTNSR